MWFVGEETLPMRVTAIHEVGLLFHQITYVNASTPKNQLIYANLC
jgi:hypothetical protein